MTEHNWVVYSDDEDGEVIACSNCGLFEDDHPPEECEGPASVEKAKEVLGGLS